MAQPLLFFSSFASYRLCYTVLLHYAAHPLCWTEKRAAAPLRGALGKHLPLHSAAVGRFLCSSRWIETKLSVHLWIITNPKTFLTKQRH